jgi:hypothetical protein
MHTAAIRGSSAAAGSATACEINSSGNAAQNTTVQSAGAAAKRPGTFTGPKVVLCTTTALTIA